MRATKFVKKFGWEKAIDNVAYLERSRSLSVNRQTLLDELKHLIESYELVEKCGGLNSLKAWVKETKSELSLATYFHCNKPPILIQIENAEKAIADVESCQ